MILRDLHPIERPREKLERSGAEALSDQELLALILRTGYRGRGVTDLAGELLGAFPGGLAAAGCRELARVKGMGKSRAAAVAACFELARRHNSRDDARPVLDSPRSILPLVPASVRNGRKEHFLAFYLNARNQLLHFETVSIGTLSASLVHPREVFSPAISTSAAALVVAHNHPSGDTSPSAEDKDATRRLLRSGELLGIPLLDHLIVADTGFFSFRENGLLS